MALSEWFVSQAALTRDSDNQASHPIIHERDQREAGSGWKKIKNQKMANISFQIRHRRTSY